MWSGLFGENRKDLGLGGTTVQVCSALSQAWDRKWEAPADPLGPGNGASGAGMLGSSSVLMLGALLTSLLPHPHPKDVSAQNGNPEPALGGTGRQGSPAEGSHPEV